MHVLDFNLKHDRCVRVACFVRSPETCHYDRPRHSWSSWPLRTTSKTSSKIETKLLHRKSCKTRQLSLKQALFARLCIGDLIDHEADTALGNDIRDAVAYLNGHHGVGGGDAKHREEVHNWVSAPADHCHHLCKYDFLLDHRIALAVRGRTETNQQLEQLITVITCASTIFSLVTGSLSLFVA